jgi:hypothetical protein
MDGIMAFLGIMLFAIAAGWVTYCLMTVLEINSRTKRIEQMLKDMD